MQEIKGKKTHINQLDVDSTETADEAINDYVLLLGLQ
jgi:hypothetical protein